jgi:flagellar hook protein FlgE
MKTQINATTGQNEVVFSAKVLSISAKPLSNVNGTEYRPATIEFKDAAGKTQQTSCIVYEKNYQHGISVGNSYMATAAQTPKGVLITLSHLTDAARPDESMFVFGSVAAVAEPKLNA